MSHTTICMPAVKSFRNPKEIELKNPDWKRIKCPACGEECYESELAREAIEKYGWETMCTHCAMSKK